MYQILLVEDDKRIREVISDYFANQEEKKIRLDMAEDGNIALDKIYENAYDLILLDIMLPGVDGYEICREVRKEKDIPIIFLTAKSQEEDIIKGYDLGCDDYIVKPFSISVLNKKIQALLNRSKGTVLSEELTAGDIVLNPRTLQVKVKGENIELSPKQYMILKILMENKGNVVSRDAILVRIWGYDYDGDERILDNHMKKLRKALSSEGKRIKTVIARGYKIQE